jgi:uncharacterized integral membrane protein
VRLRKRDPDASPGDDTFQPRLWLTIGGLLLVLAYMVAFVVANSDNVKVSFVFYSTRTSLIWLILLSAVVGLVGGILLSQLMRRRGRR